MKTIHFTDDEHQRHLAFMRRLVIAADPPSLEAEELLEALETDRPVEACTSVHRFPPHNNPHGVCYCTETSFRTHPDPVASRKAPLAAAVSTLRPGTGGLRSLERSRPHRDGDGIDQSERTTNDEHSFEL